MMTFFTSGNGFFTVDLVRLVIGNDEIIKLLFINIPMVVYHFLKLPLLGFIRFQEAVASVTLIGMYVGISGVNSV